MVTPATPSTKQDQNSGTARVAAKQPAYPTTAPNKVARVQTRATGILSDEDSQWLRKSTDASGVPLQVRSKQAIEGLASLITLSKRS